MTASPPAAPGAVFKLNPGAGRLQPGQQLESSFRREKSDFGEAPHLPGLFSSPTGWDAQGVHKAGEGFSRL
ncbi:MAG: hypothetical protein IIC64_15375 [SAR324 cluster bacterium]|nr:hypothetical protein [SAR324 cluster bacterium]